MKISENSIDINFDEKIFNDMKFEFMEFDEKIFNDMRFEIK